MNHRRNKPSIVLALLCLVAGGALFLQTRSALLPPPGFPEPVVEARPVAYEPVALTVDFPPPASFDEIVQRPLFAETRTPPPPPDAPAAEEEAPPAPPERDLFALLGVVISDARQVAVVKLKKTGEINHVTVGQTLAGWEVSEIGPRTILFVNGELRNLVNLQDLPGASRKPGPEPRPFQRPGSPSEAAQVQPPAIPGPQTQQRPPR